MIAQEKSSDAYRSTRRNTFFERVTECRDIHLMALSLSGLKLFSVFFFFFVLFFRPLTRLVYQSGCLPFLSYLDCVFYFFIF